MPPNPTYPCGGAVVHSPPMEAGGASPGRATCAGALPPSALPGVTWPVRWQGYTPLLQAAMHGHADITVTLIDHKADVTSADKTVSLARPACREPLWLCSRFSLMLLHNFPCN